VTYSQRRRLPYVFAGIFIRRLYIDDVQKNVRSADEWMKSLLRLRGAKEDNASHVRGRRTS
jgi:hypothetical protein